MFFQKTGSAAPLSLPFLPSWRLRGWPCLKWLFFMLWVSSARLQNHCSFPSSCFYPCLFSVNVCSWEEKLPLGGSGDLGWLSGVCPPPPPPSLLTGCIKHSPGDTPGAHAECFPLLSPRRPLLLEPFCHLLPVHERECR